MKKIFVCLLFAALLLASCPLADAASSKVTVTRPANGEQRVSNDISERQNPQSRGTSPIKEAGEFLGGYPIVGKDHTAKYFLDTESCICYIKGGTATLECLVYGVGEDERFYTLHYRFDTYKKDGKRKIFLKKVTAQTGHDLTQNRLRWDNGFAYFLFWQTAHYAGISHALD